jgi:hypothetical protein
VEDGEYQVLVNELHSRVNGDNDLDAWFQSRYCWFDHDDIGLGTNTSRVLFRYVQLHYKILA